ncbi:MAG: hypothetical protein WBO06_14205 [Gammaproteobacteria bacterium]
MTAIEIYLKSCHELTRFCSQNGWIDTESLRYNVIWETVNEVCIDVVFDELLMEGGGDLAVKMSCRGQMRLLLDYRGSIIQAEIL